MKFTQSLRLKLLAWMLLICFIASIGQGVVAKITEQLLDISGLSSNPEHNLIRNYFS